MISIMDTITLVTIALFITLIILGIKINSLYQAKKAGKIERIFDFRRRKPKARSAPVPAPMEKSYKNIVRCIEEGLLKVKKPEVSTEEFHRRLEEFKNFDYRNIKDDDIFWALTYIIFFNMGKKASMIEKKLPMLKEHLFGYEKLAGLSDMEVTRIVVHTGFERQVRWCKANAETFKGLVSKFGSFKEYLAKEYNICGTDSSNEQLIMLHKDLAMLFEGIGETAGWHFITEMGFFSLKPDKVIRRIFSRLGLTDKEDDMDGALNVGRQISTELQLPIRYIDIIFAKYGQAGESDLLGTTDGICTDSNPKCDICQLKTFCRYTAEVEAARQAQPTAQ